MENMNDLERLDAISTKIKLELSIRLSSPEYMLWINPLVPYSIDEEFMTFVAPSENAANTIRTHYADRFREIALSLHLPVTDFIFKTENQLTAKKEEPESDEDTIVVEERKNPFVKKYTFDNFIIADTNRLAAASAQAVAKNPGSNEDLLTLNPLYIYGGVGLGKTHLLHAIGNYLFENNPSLNVIYTTAEKISNDYFASLNQYSTDKDAYRNFRKKYSSCDVLMVDDVQFMQKKGGLQEVFFHIFNDLYIDHRQIVLSSDRPPKEINDIEDRLRSRFESGMMTDISSPSLDTRINIINKKLHDSNQYLDYEIVTFLAERVNTNIRELEGALQKVIMYSTLTHRKPTIDIAREALKEKEDSKVKMDSEFIINVVSEYYRIPSSEIIGKKKTKDVAEARMIAIYLVCNILNLPLVSVGQIFGGRDHTTIIYSRDKISALLIGNNNIKKTVEDIRSVLGC